MQPGAQVGPRDPAHLHPEPAEQGLDVELKEQALGWPQDRIAEPLPDAPGVLGGHAPAQEPRPFRLLDGLGDGDQQAFAGPEVVQQHAVTGADGRRQLAQAEIGDPAPHGLLDRGREQAVTRLRCGHG